MKRSGVPSDGPDGVVNRRRAAAVAAATLTLGLAACSTASPAVIQTPYQAADGTSAVIPGIGIKLRNFLVVSNAKGSPGQVVGAVINPSANPVMVTMQTDLGTTGQPAQTAIKVPAHGITQVGPAGTQVVVTDTPVAPGALMAISANYQSDGGISLTVPVVPATGYYSSYTAAPTTAPPSPSASPSEGASASASATSSDSTQEPTPSVTSTN